MQNRYDVVFEIKQEQVSEEYLGEFEITDKETDRSHTFYMRGDDHPDYNFRTFHPQYINEGQLGHTAIWTENLNDIDLVKFPDSYSLEERIEDEKDPLNIDEFVVNHDNYFATVQQVLNHYQNGVSEKVLFNGADNEFYSKIFLNRELAELMKKVVDKHVKKRDVVELVQTVKGTPSETYYSNEILKVFDNARLNAASVEFLSHLPEEKRNELRYSATIQPNVSHSDIVADITFHDRASNTYSQYAIFSDENMFDEYYTAEDTIGGNYIYIHQVPEDFSLADYSKLEHYREALVDDFQMQTDIDDVFLNEAVTVKEALAQHHKTEEVRTLELKDKEFLSNQVANILAHDKLLEAGLKVKEDRLEKADVLQLAKVLDNPKIVLEGDFKGFEQPFMKIYKDNLLSNKENNLFKNMFNKLNLDGKLLNKFKKREMALER